MPSWSSAAPTVVVSKPVEHEGQHAGLLGGGADQAQAGDRLRAAAVA